MELDAERIPLTGFPGTWTVIQAESRGYQEVPGAKKYAVRFILGTPALEPFRFASDGESVELATDLPGDSPIKFPDLPADGMHELGIANKGLGGRIRVELRVNRHQRLSSLTAFVEAVDPRAAAHRAGEFLMPHLNWLSFVHDVGVSIVAIDVVDEQQTHRWTYYYRHYDVAAQNLTDIKSEFPDQLIPLLALWREAMSSTNPYYQVITFRRVLEGIEYCGKEFGKFKPANLREERFPDDKRIWAAYRGEKIGPFLDEVKKIRSFFAHFALDDKDVIHIPDLVEGRRKIETIIPMLRFATKLKLDNLRLKILACYTQGGARVTHFAPIPMRMDY